MKMMMGLMFPCRTPQGRVPLAYQLVKMLMGYNLGFPLGDQICMKAQTYTPHFEHNVSKEAHPETLTKFQWRNCNFSFLTRKKQGRAYWTERKAHWAKPKV